MSDDNVQGTEHATHHDGERAHRRPRMTGWIVTMVTALILVAVGFAGVAIGTTKGGGRTSTITVTGSGTVRGVPDTINFQIGVSTTNPSATGALDANDAKVRLLEAALAKNGVTKVEMQTSGLNIYQNTNRFGAVTGFTVQDTLSVTMHHIKRAGTAIDAAAHAVGNGVQFDGVSFTITNDSALLRAARVRAIDSAHFAASQIARAGGTHVAGIVKITDNENQSTGVYSAPLAMGAAFKSSVPIETGSQPINVQVTVVYSLSS